jgi:tetratricopeptide (TPR) repeat protein
LSCPNLAIAYYAKGLSLAYLVEHEESIKAYGKAIGLGANSSSMYYNAGVALLNLKI